MPVIAAGDAGGFDGGTGVWSPVSPLPPSPLPGLAARAAAACSLDSAAMEGGGVAGPDPGPFGGVPGVDCPGPAASGSAALPLSAQAARAAVTSPAIPSSTERRPANGRRLESPMDVLVY
ncbi:hypothetical protein ACTAQJ_03810 [Arthrobacter sp. alpha11c]